MWQSLYERLRHRQEKPDEARTDATGEATFLRAPPPPGEDDATPRCPACPGVRLMEHRDPEHLWCVWCTRVFTRDELASEAA